MNIVILHGWGHSSAMWESFIKKLPKGAIALDLPGFGNEKLVSEDWDIKDYAEWTVKKLKNKKVKKTVLIGHSFGGKVATEIAINNPEMVSKLILIAAPVLRRPSITTKVKILVHKIAKKVLLKNALNQFTNDEYRDAKKANLGRIFVKSVNYDAGEKLKKIKAYTLIIWGEDDQDAPLFIGKQMKEMINGSKLETLKNTGHNIYLENPNILYGLITKFINEKHN